MTKKLFTIVNIALLLISSVFLPGCVKTNKHQVFVVVLDLTASTDPEGRAVAFEAMQAWFNQKRVHRGDMITIIPITGDALTQTQGKVLRFRVNETRATYDEDLRTLATQVRESLERMEKEAEQNPYQHSDVIGAFRLAAEELARQSSKSRKVLIALSDFIQDDRQANFNLAPQLMNKPAAIPYARQMAVSHPLHFDAQVVYLGWLRSKDLGAMGPPRRDALEAFWNEYLRVQGVNSLIIATDGPGGLDRVVESD